MWSRSLAFSCCNAALHTAVVSSRRLQRHVHTSTCWQAMRELRASCMAPDAPLVHAMSASGTREPAEELAVLIDEANQYGQPSQTERTS
jgi:hypothetical protein